MIWGPRTLRILDLLAHPVSPIPDHEDHRPREEYGKIQSAGLDFWGDAIVFSLPPGVKTLPGSFRVLLDESRCSTACHYVPRLLLHVKIRKTEVRERITLGKLAIALQMRLSEPFSESLGATATSKRRRTPNFPPSLSVGSAVTTLHKRTT